MMEIGDSSALEDWKAKTLKRFGNVEMEFNNEAKNWFDRVKVNNDAFGDVKAGFTKSKQDFIDKERDFFKKNPRMSMMVNLYDKKNTDIKKKYQHILNNLQV